MQTHRHWKLSLASAFAIILASALSCFGQLGTVNLGNVYTHLELTNGQILVGGDFGVVRLNDDGTVDTGFSCSYPNGHGSVFSIAVGPSGSVYVGGSFSWPENDDYVFPVNVARINSNGSLDSSFNPGPDYPVYAIAVQSDGYVVLGGDFLAVGTSSVKRITRVSSFGGIDSAFHYHNRGLDNTVRTIVLQTNGQILVGGDFFYFDDNGTSTTNSAPHIMRLNSDGTRDTGFTNSASAYPGGVYALALQSNGKIIAGGIPTLTGWSTGSGLARLNSDGSFDSQNPGGVYGITVKSIAVDSSYPTDGRAYFGGTFTSVLSEPHYGLAGLTVMPAVDSGFTYGFGAGGTGAAVYAISLSTNSTIVVSGNFTSYDGYTRYGIARVKTYQGHLYDP